MQNTLSTLLESLPKIARVGVQDYIQSLRQLHDENLTSVILYGSAARGDYIPGISNLNLLIVLKDSDIGVVKKARRISRRVRKRFSVEPRFMSVEAIRNASDVLPIAFLDMQQQYIVLYGKDVLAEISVERRNLRYQCEYQLRYALLRLRNLFLFSSHKQSLMTRQLNQSFTVYLHLIKSMYYLLDETPPVRAQEIISGVAERFGLDQTVMQNLFDLKLKKHRFNRLEVEKLFEAYLDQIAKAIQVVEGLDME